jgi:hypothetical protein
MSVSHHHKGERQEQEKSQSHHSFKTRLPVPCADHLRSLHDHCKHRQYAVYGERNLFLIR